MLSNHQVLVCVCSDTWHDLESIHKSVPFWCNFAENCHKSGPFWYAFGALLVKIVTKVSPSGALWVQFW